MTLIEDMAEEMMGEFKETIHVYSHSGYDDEGDEFWYSDQGYDGAGGYDFDSLSPDHTMNARVRWGMIEGNREFSEDEIQYPAGFKESSSVDIYFYVLEDKIEEGDVVEYDNRYWNVGKKVTEYIQGRKYRYIYGAKSTEA